MASDGGPASPPPAASPPPPPGEAEMHHDIARDIGQLVEIMILDAKHNSETKVGKEIQKLKSKIEQIGDKIKMVTERLSRVEPSSGGLLKSDLQKSIAKLEEVWEGEVGALKQELWQTIQAHNHNADLLKDHKEAIDRVQNSMGEGAPNPELEQVHAQLVQVDKVMQRELAKEQQMDQLMQRLAVVQQQLLGAGVGGWPPAGLPPFSMPQGGLQANAAAAAKKNQQRKVPKSGKAPKAAGAAAMPPNLRAEAPEFVPTVSP